MTTRTTNASKLLMASAVAGLLAIASNTTMVAPAHAAEDGKVKCYGANKCKGTGGCAGAGHACAGKNACKGQGFVEVESKDACMKMEGGRLAPDK